MSKSKGNIYYTDMLSREGYSMQEIRFFLIYEHYRKDLNFSVDNMASAVRGLKEFKRHMRAIKKRASSSSAKDSAVSGNILKVFSEHMDKDLSVKDAFDKVHSIISGTDVHSLTQAEASGIIRALKKIDEVLQVIF